MKEPADDLEGVGSRENKESLMTPMFLALKRNSVGTVVLFKRMGEMEGGIDSKWGGNWRTLNPSVRREHTSTGKGGLLKSPVFCQVGMALWLNVNL